MADQLPTGSTSTELGSTKSIDFGFVRKYFPDRGFGFVGHTFLPGPRPESFFHVKSLGKADRQLTEALAKFTPGKTVCFWYETEITSKGEQVRTVLLPEMIRDVPRSDLSVHLQKLDHYWANTPRVLPTWLPEVTVVLVGKERAEELKSVREALKEQERKALEVLRVEQAGLQATRAEESRRYMQEVIELQESKKREFQELLAELRPLGFTESWQASKYLFERHLGNKYKSISGVLKMKLGGEVWSFSGGFPTDVFARLCRELNLRDRGSGARAIEFKSYRSLEAEGPR